MRDGNLFSNYAYFAYITLYSPRTSGLVFGNNQINCVVFSLRITLYNFLLVKMDRLTLKQAMYLSWFMAVSRRLSISSGEANEADYEGNSKNIANLYAILQDETWTNLNISKQEEIEISEQSNFIYFNKRNEVDWAADNMHLVREELKGVGSLIAPPIEFKTNLFEGQNLLKSFRNG